MNTQGNIYANNDFQKTGQLEDNTYILTPQKNLSYIS